MATLWSNKRSLGFFSIWFLDYFSMSISVQSASELESSLMSFAISDSTSTWQGGDTRKRKLREEWGGEGRRLFEGGNYSRKYILIVANILYCLNLQLKQTFSISFLQTVWTLHQNQERIKWSSLDRTDCLGWFPVPTLKSFLDRVLDPTSSPGLLQ